MFGGNQCGNHRSSSRRIKNPDCARHKGYRIDMPHRDVSRGRQECKQQGEQHGQALGNYQKPPPIHPICDDTAGYGKNHYRKRAKKSRQSQLKRRVGDFINLPRDRHCGNLGTHRGEQKTGPEETEVSL